MPNDKINHTGLDSIYRPIADDMGEVERRLAESLRPAVPFVGELVSHATGNGGKRLRPALLFLAARAAGEVNEQHIRYALAIESIHTATLVHDDVLDEATLRRGRPSMNVLWGNEASILFGDYLLAGAYRLAASAGNMRALDIIAATAAEVCEGELMQIAEKNNLRLSEERYREIITRKTASLCATACRLGALLTGADKKVEDSLADYGRGVGVAFQIIDDCLDLTGDEREAGKSLGTDLRKGKYTLPVIHFLKTAADAEDMTLRAASGDLPLAELRAALESAGSIRYAFDAARREAARAQSALSAVPPSDARNSLALLADYIVARK